MVWTDRFRRGVLGSCALAMLGATAALYAADLSVLRKVEPGLWDIQSRDVRDRGRTMCIADPLVLTQLAHPGLACTRFVISSTEDSVAVHYSCAGTGNGQTDIRVETPRLVQIETQGMVRQTPFQWRYQARRIGECSTPKK